MKKQHFFKLFILVGLLTILFACGSAKKYKGKNKPYEYGRVPKNYKFVLNEYESYHKFIGCKQGETIASIGAGNGMKEVQVSCFVDGITWYLEEIDSTRIYEFDKVLTYHEGLKGSPLNGEFNLVLGTETSTTLPKGIFDRIILINVFHEIASREPIMLEILELLKPSGELVIMERMAKEPNQFHGDCKHPKLFEPEFLVEMDGYGYESKDQNLGEEVSNLMYYIFESKLKSPSSNQ